MYFHKSTMEFVKSEKGKDKLIYEGFEYVKQKNLANEVVSFECIQRRYKSACKAKVKVLGQEIVGRLHEHTHGPDPARKEVLKAVEKMKRRAEETEETPQQIITQSVSCLSQDAKANLPTMHVLRRSVRRCRQQVGNPVPVPLSGEDFNIPDRYKMTNDGQSFLLYDSGPSNKRILIFGTQENLRLLEINPHWFMDGTFKTAPGIFTQLYTIHAFVNNRSLPCIYALLPDKKETTYNVMLTELKNFNSNLQPTSIMVDYEAAIINTIRDNFPNTDVKGCFFHLSQNIFRKIQEHGLQVKYQDDSDFALQLKMIPALAFVPIQDVIKAFDALSEILPGEAQPILDYFEDNYLGRPQRHGRRQPTFTIDLWNMSQRVEEELPKTNNNVEGWHKSFQSNVGCCHPNLWKFITFIQREQDLQQTHYTQAMAGHASQPARKKYFDSHQRILKIVRDYPNRAILDFLRGIAHNLSF